MRKSKEYKRMMRTYRKRIRKWAKESSQNPFSGGAGLEMFMEYVRFMLAYYTLNENVWSEDNIYELEMGRIESLSETVKAYDNYLHCDEKYVYWNDGDIVYKYPDDHQRTLRECTEETDYWWNRMWELMRKYYNYWWD